jgi:hypothetical protein
MHMLDLSRPKLYTYYKFLEAYKALCTMVRASPAVGENSNPKTSYWGRYKTCFGVLKVFSPTERENSISNEKNSGLGEERSPLYLRGGRL